MNRTANLAGADNRRCEAALITAGPPPAAAAQSGRRRPQPPLWLLALVPGLLLGRWVAMWMGNSFTSDLMSFEVVIFFSTYLLTAGGILLTMLLAALPAVRRVNHLNLAEATKVYT